MAYLSIKSPLFRKIRLFLTESSKGNPDSGKGKLSDCRGEPFGGYWKTWSATGWNLSKKSKREWRLQP
jgi:hypothetical protein